jgi:hypothetical protein
MINLEYLEKLLRIAMAYDFERRIKKKKADNRCLLPQFKKIILIQAKIESDYNGHSRSVAF